MQHNGVVVQMPTGGGRGRRPPRDPVKMMNPQAASELCGLSYWCVLELFKAHGKKIGGRYYMSEVRFRELLEHWGE